MKFYDRLTIIVLYCIQKYFTYDFNFDFMIFIKKNSGTILRFKFQKRFPCRVKIVILTTLLARVCQYHNITFNFYLSRSSDISNTWITQQLANFLVLVQWPVQRTTSLNLELQEGHDYWLVHLLVKWICF